MSNLKEKNKLDLEYHKYSQYFNSLIIVTVTVLFGFLLSLLTNQIVVGKNFPFIFVTLLSVIIIISSVYFLIKFHNNMNAIINRVNKLNI